MRYITAILLTLLCASSWAVDTKVSALPAVTPAGADTIYVIQGGVSSRCTLLDVYHALTSAGLTATRVPYATGAGGLLTDSANLTYAPTAGTGGLTVANTTPSTTLITGSVIAGGGIGASGQVTATTLKAMPAATQDGIIVAGRAGGTSSYAVTIKPAAESASYDLTIPTLGAGDTIATLGLGNAFTGANTFTSASGVVTTAAATQDSIRIAGRAGGTSSYIGTIQPTTLTGSRTYTMPDATGTVALTNITVPGTASTYAGTTVTMTSTETQALGDAVQIDSGGLCHLAKADSLAHASAVFICVSAPSGSASATYAMPGCIIKLAASASWTAGNVIYLSVTGTTTNTLTKTAPSTSTNIVQILGVALANDTLLFQPSLVQVTVL